jgi:hypothetical protein
MKGNQTYEHHSSMRFNVKENKKMNKIDKPKLPTTENLIVVSSKTKEGRALLGTHSATSAGLVISKFSQTLGKQDENSVIDTLEAQIKNVINNDMTDVEAMLLAQAKALQTIFTELSLRAHANIGEYLGATESYLKLAMKAQNQCRMTLETLSTIKNPPVIYAKQANIANGPQQVNNGNSIFGANTCAHTRENQISPNQLSGVLNELHSHARTTSCSSGAYQTVEAVGKIDRTENARRKGRVC